MSKDVWLHFLGLLKLALGNIVLIFIFCKSLYFAMFISLVLLALLAVVCLMSIFPTEFDIHFFFVKTLDFNWFYMRRILNRETLTYLRLFFSWACRLKLCSDVYVVVLFAYGSFNIYLLIQKKIYHNLTTLHCRCCHKAKTN